MNAAEPRPTQGGRWALREKRDDWAGIGTFAECNNVVLQVCSNHNETFASGCDLHRKRCLCEESRDGVEGIGSACGEANMYKHIHIEYYGTCPLSKIMNGNTITIRVGLLC